MPVFLLIVYIIAFAAQAVLLYLSTMKNEKVFWLSLFITEGASFVVGLILSIIYNNLPGEGMMPGLAYFGETLFSISATVLYGAMLIISGLFFLFLKLKDR